jgi:hypothetical protein
MDSPVSSFNLKSLRGSFALLLAVILLVAAMLAASFHFSRQIRQAHKRDLAQQTETHAKLERVNDEEREIGEKINRFGELVSTGRIAAERRLEWVETLNHIKESRRLLGLEYEISPQRLLDEKTPTSGGYAFLASPMRLELPLLHENDLLGLLADLSKQVQALVSVRSCKIERSASDPKYPNAMLKARCEIDWITLQEKS